MKRPQMLLVGAGLLLGLAVTSGLAWAAPQKAVFYDSAIKPGWSDQAESISKYFETDGYDLLDSVDLVRFMTKRIADKAPSVIVFATDSAPTTVVPKATKKCLLREYLDAGGKIVWIGDIPLYYICDPDTSVSTTLGDSGASSVIGVGQTGKWDAGEDVVITEEGQKWGITETWASGRAVKVSKLSTTVKTLATIGEGVGTYSAAWVKSFGGPDGTGFVRLWDRAGAPSDLAWVKSVAEYGLK